MDSPLNWAHLQERKAESFLNCHQFSEAIKCYQKAAEYLVEAMNLTHVSQALASMQLQYESNIRQEKVLKDKWKRYELHQEQIRHEKERLRKELLDKSSQKSFKTPSSDDLDRQKKCEHLNTSTCSLVISAESFSVSSLSSSTELLTSKDDKDEVSELRNQVRDLQIQQLSLTQALEDSNRENAKLKKTISLLKEILKNRLNIDFDKSVVTGEVDEENKALFNPTQMNKSQVVNEDEKPDDKSTQQKL